MDHPGGSVQEIVGNLGVELRRKARGSEMITLGHIEMNDLK